MNDAGLSFAIVSPNQPPQITGSQTTLAYIENDPPVHVLDDIEVLDDNDNLGGATVNISSNYFNGLDFLEADPSGGIQVDFDSDFGVLSLTGDASVSDYINVIRSVRFYNISDDPSLEIRTLTLQVTDGVNFSGQFSKSLIITPINDAPSIIDTNDSIFVSTDEEIPLEICLEAVDFDSDQFEFESYELKNNSGTIEESADLCLLYTPQTDFDGDEYVTVILCDMEVNSLCDLTIIAIDIIPVNDPPIVVDPGPDPPDTQVQVDSTGFKTEKNTNLNFCLEGFDIDGDNIDVTDISYDQTGNGILTHTGGLCFDFVPATGYVGFINIFSIIFYND